MTARLQGECSTTELIGHVLSVFSHQGKSSKPDLNRRMRVLQTRALDLLATGTLRPAELPLAEQGESATPTLILILTLIQTSNGLISVKARRWQGAHCQVFTE